MRVKVSAVTGGSPYGHNDAIVDVTDSVLLEQVGVVAITDPGGPRGYVLALELGGRVNKSAERASHLYLMDEDGAAAIVSELLGLAARISPAFLDDLLTRIRNLP